MMRATDDPDRWPDQAGEGFAEAGAAFVRYSQAEERFSESLELMRKFSALDDPEARRRVLDLVRQLAGK